MKSILDPSFEYTSSIDTDIRRTFDRVWRELGERGDAAADEARDTLWLECSGDLVSVASVGRLTERNSALGVAMIEFVCPRCGERHESLRFR